MFTNATKKRYVQYVPDEKAYNLGAAYLVHVKKALLNALAADLLQEVDYGDWSAVVFRLLQSPADYGTTHAIEFSFVSLADIQARTVYAFQVLFNKHECGFLTLSLHKTKSGAYRVMRSFLVESYQRWREDWFLHGRNFFQRGGKDFQHDFDSVRIREVRIEL